jgi:hypothetical protein
MSNKEENTSKPFIGEHRSSSSFNNLPSGEKQTIFEDFTDNHNKAVVVAHTEDNPLTLIIKTRDGKKIKRTVDSESDIAVQVEDIEKVSIICNATTGTCSGFVDIEKTFCIEC